MADEDARGQDGRAKESSFNLNQELENMIIVPLMKIYTCLTLNANQQHQSAEMDAIRIILIACKSHSMQPIAAVQNFYHTGWWTVGGGITKFTL